MNPRRLHISLRQALLAAAVSGAVLVLNGCSTPAPELNPKADYKEFTDVTWKPESTVRAPLRSTELKIDPVEALTEGIYAFHDKQASFVQIRPAGDGLWDVSETIQGDGERAFNWGTGASTLYRSGVAMPNSGRMSVERLGDGRILLRNAGETPFNMAVELRAFDISGKPIRQFLRNSNNQPDELAWFMSADAKFPEDSRAYIATYWLGDDEIVQPSSSAFTGAATLERLVAQFSKTTPFCLSYVSYVAAQPYGVIFTPNDSQAKPRSRRSRQLSDSGSFSLVPVSSRSIFCEPRTDGARQTGLWRIRYIQGTRVLELMPGESVASSDLGVQPVNRNAITVGFAEVVRPAATDRKGGRASTAVVPVRVLANNKAIADFRLKFNPTAAAAVREAMVKADASREAWNAREKARIKAQLEAGRTQQGAQPAAVPASADSRPAPPSGSGAVPSARDPMGAFLQGQ